MEFDYLTAADIRFPEGPAFSSDGTLWCVEQHGESLIQYTGDGRYKRHTVGGRPNGLTLDANDTLWFCDSGHNAIRTFAPATGATQTIVDQLAGEPLNMPNDLAFDGHGQLLFTCPGPTLDVPGYVCCLTRTGNLSVIATDLYYPNGLALSADGTHLLIAETGKQRIWIGEWDPTATRWHSPRIFALTEGGLGPDGMAFHNGGYLYVAVYGSASIQVFTPSGALAERIMVPGLNPTNCAFDPSGHLGLIVTEAEHGRLLYGKH